jgi:glycosyltransferase EpsF
MSIKVLHLITSLNPGGIERWLLSMLQYIDRKHVEMDFICKGSNIGTLAPSAIEMKSKVYHCPLRFDQIRYLLNVEKIIKNGKYDIIHNHLETYSGLGVLVANKLRKPVITSFHNTNFMEQELPNYPIIRALRKIYGDISINFALQKSDLITGCSNSVINFLKREYYLQAGKSKIIYYGVPLTYQNPPDQRKIFCQELNIDVDRVIVVHVGRFLEQKNHHGLVEIAAKALQANQKLHFIMVGDGPLKGRIESMVKNLNLSEHFSFLGLRNDVEMLLCCSDIFFLPSFFEGLPVVSLEAMAAGLPIIASDIPEIREAVIDGVTGVLWSHQDQEGMASKILKLAEDPTRRKIMGEAGRKCVEEKFSVNISAKRLCQVYENISDS